MNPNFALDFRSDQIILLHSQEGVWVEIGRVAVDDPDLDAALGYMRSTALGLSPRGIASKLILPDAAILYTTLGDLSADPQTRAAQIAQALIGRTPYDVADLVFDWTDSGPSAQLAVIARETLDEAEGFANQHRLNPVAFAAWPEQGQYPGEADFGRSATAAEIITLLPDVQTQNAAETLSASDFEMGEAAEDISAEQSAASDILSADFAAKDEPQADLTPMDVPQDLPEPVAPAEIAAMTPADAAPEANTDTDDAPYLLDTEDTADVQSDETPADETPADVVQSEFTPDLAQVDPEQAGPSDTALVVQPDLFAPVTVAPPETVDEAPMALDVPVDETVVDEPAQMAGPSAGKAQTLLAEFAARREAALGKADSAGRIEPVVSAAKSATPSIAAPSVKIAAASAPKLSAVASQNPSRTPEASLGSKPAVKRPAAKPRGSRSVLVGFILTILLLLALAAAAAMSSYLTTAWNSYGASLIIASDQPSVADEVTADLPDTQTPSNPAPKTVELAVQNALPAPVTLPVPSLASETASSLVLTPAALPQPIVVAPPDISTASADTPEAPLITPTAQGVMSPEGVFLIAGRPRVLPLARPVTVVSTTFADPALAGKNPRIRPDGLAPPLAAEPLANDPALAGKRPLARSETVLAAANAAQIALASLAEVQDAPRSLMAVSISRLPVARPKGLKTTLETPQELALATPEIATPEITAPEEPAANAPLEADNEPEVSAPKSSGPRTVVSKNATYKNAINLSNVNLIGVFGSQSNRYALIRQSNGRFKKVYVGDRFDGGLVAAITESELRYSKGGQMLALQMPKG